MAKSLPSNAEAAGDPGSVSGMGRSPGGENSNPLQYSCQDNPMDREARRATIHRVAKSLTRLASLMAQTVKNLPAMKETWVRSLGWEDPRRRKWQPTPVFLPGEFYGQRSLAGYSPWGCKESDMTERLHFSLQAYASNSGPTMLKLNGFRFQNLKQPPNDIWKVRRDRDFLASTNSHGRVELSFASTCFYFVMIQS